MTSEWIERMSAELSGAATEEFSGVVTVYQHGRPVLELASGLANRAGNTPMTLETQLATASGTKGFTALAVVSMIEEGLFGFKTPIAELVGDDLPNVDRAVTIEQLLCHTSGVGDYLNEEKLGHIDEYVLDVPVHRLLGPEDYVQIVKKFPQLEAPGERFRYNNSGYVMLALAMERASGCNYHDEVRRRVFDQAGMEDTHFTRSDHLPPNAALGYLTDGRTNVLHLPVVGTGDGGAYTTALDMRRFWNSLFSGKIVASPLVEQMITPRHQDSDGKELHRPVGDRHYGRGFWIGADSETVTLEGMDAGVSFRSGFNQESQVSYCTLANNSADVWPIASIIDHHLTQHVFGLRLEH